ncbi:MAG: hypothetical protein HUK21_12785, partial [Fibrobacteraceae bacterium]|nr:hypothetical protein [Fibrobacteraceae bacterium]
QDPDSIPEGIFKVSPVAAFNLSALEAAGKVQYFDMQGNRLNKAATQKPGVYTVRILGGRSFVKRVEK